MRYYRPDRKKHETVLQMEIGAYAQDAKKQKDLLKRRADALPQNHEAVYFFDSKKHAELKQLFSYTGKIGGTVSYIDYKLDNNGFICAVVTLDMVVEGSNRRVDVIIDQLDLWNKDIGIGDQIILIDNPPKRIGIYMIHRKVTPPGTYQIITTCPVCHRESVEVNHKSKRRCINPGCYGIMRSTLKKMNSKDGHEFNFRWGELERLIQVCNIRRATDILKVNMDDLRKAFLFDSSSQLEEKLSRLQRKNISLESKIYSLNIPSVRFDLAKTMARYYGSIERLLKTTSSEITGLRGSSHAMFEFLNDAENVEEITKYILLTR